MEAAPEKRSCTHTRTRLSSTLSFLMLGDFPQQPAEYSKLHSDEAMESGSEENSENGNANNDSSKPWEREEKGGGGGGEQM